MAFRTTMMLFETIHLLLNNLKRKIVKQVMPSKGWESGATQKIKKKNCAFGIELLVETFPNRY